MPNSTAVEPRYGCPVCTGLPMQKLQITQREQGVFLTLDYCKRCGGVWFDKDEVKLSQQIKSSKVRQYITQQPRKWMIPCHECNTLMDRNLENCGTCGWHNQIYCPVCTKTLQRKHHKNLTLDICHSCQGVWFDQTELTSLWRQSSTEIEKSSDKQITKGADTTHQHLPVQEPGHNQSNFIGETVSQPLVDGGLDGVTQGGADFAQYMVHTAGNIKNISAQTLSNTPDFAGGIVESLAEVTGAAIESVGELPELAIGILEVTGEIAASMTEVLAEVISGLFSG